MKEITTDLPSAEEARRSVENGVYEKALEQMAKIQTLIFEAISNGKQTVSGDGTLEPSVKKVLEEKGYRCSAGSQYNETYWSVSWF